MNRSTWLRHSCKILLLAALLVASGETLVAPAQAQGIEFWNKGCLKAYKKWKTLATHKAFALTNSNAGAGNRQACGYSWAAPSKAVAEQNAIKSCQAQNSGKCYVTKSK